MHLSSTGTTLHDQQDLVNRLLAASLHTRATRDEVIRTATLISAEHPQAAADLTAAAAALTDIHYALVRAADTALGLCQERLWRSFGGDGA